MGLSDLLGSRGLKEVSGNAEAVTASVDLHGYKQGPPMGSKLPYSRTMLSVKLLE